MRRLLFILLMALSLAFLIAGRVFNSDVPAVVLLIAVVGANAAAFVRRRRAMEAFYRQRTHRCLECGYSLTGNISGYCPECGTPDLSQ